VEKRSQSKETNLLHRATTILDTRFNYCYEPTTELIYRLISALLYTHCYNVYYIVREQAQLTLSACISSVHLFSGTVLNVRKHIFERTHPKSSRTFSSIVNKKSLGIGCNKSLIRHCVIWELIDIVPPNRPKAWWHQQRVHSALNRLKHGLQISRSYLVAHGSMGRPTYCNPSSIRSVCTGCKVLVHGCIANWYSSYKLWASYGKNAGGSERHLTIQSRLFSSPCLNSQVTQVQES